MLSCALNLIFAVFFRLYRWLISPAIHLIGGSGSGCRFQPTCSAYAEEAIRIFGPYKGASMAVRRICRCHPFSRSGYDPVRAIPESSSRPRTD